LRYCRNFPKQETSGETNDFLEDFHVVLWRALWPLANATLLGRDDKMFIMILYGKHGGSP
jgi:hypothetical protein